MRLLNGTGEWEMENENKEETTPTKNQIEVLLLCLTKMTEEIKKMRADLDRISKKY